MFQLLNNIWQSVGERAAEAGKASLIGIVTIFTVLSIIWLILEISGRIFDKIKNSKEEKVKPEEIDVKDNVNKDDTEIIAAITAVINMIYEEENQRKTAEEKPVSFKVVSFRRVGGLGPWNK